MTSPPESSPAPDPTPLSDAEFDALANLLAAEWAPETTMDLEQLDGFLAGLMCAPRLVLPSTYVPVIFGDGEPNWPDTDTAQRFYGLLMRRWNEIAEALNAPIERLDDPRAYVPILIDWDENARFAQQLVSAGELERVPLYGELWASGFMQAVSLTRDDWNELPDDDEEAAQFIDDALEAIVALLPRDDDPGEDPDDKDPDDDKAQTARAPADTPARRDALVADALIAAYDLREFWRAAEFERTRVREPIRREPKIGRNDPCPCGSGRKFKNCHGRGH